MGLSNDLISQFVKAASAENNDNKESTVYGVTKIIAGKTYVQIDGSELLTPVNTTAQVNNDERVVVSIKDHSAMITGNVTSPSASAKSVEKVSNDISQFDIVMAHKVTTDDLNAINAKINDLRASVANFTEMGAVLALIETLQAKYAEIEHISATEAKIIDAEIENIRAEIGKFTNISTEELNAMYANIDELKAYNGEFTYVSAEVLNAIKATIKNLNTVYADIDFANIGEAAIEKLFSDSGIIKDLVMSDGHVTGELVGVTIIGDLIKGNTIVADKIVLRGTDGLFYELNAGEKHYYLVNYDSTTETYTTTTEELSIIPDGTLIEDVQTTDGDAVYTTSISEVVDIYYEVWADGSVPGNTIPGPITDGVLCDGHYTSNGDPVYESPSKGLYYIAPSEVTRDIYYCVKRHVVGEDEQNEYNSLDGKLITAESITANKIRVDDLVAFGATIGGFNLTSNSIYSGSKASIDNEVARGLYMDTEGQMYLGDDVNFIKYYKTEDENGNEVYKLKISAESILFANKSLNELLTEHVKMGTFTNDDGGQEPSIELSEGDSDYKQIITNTKTLYKNGETVKTRIDTDGIETDNVVVNDEIQHKGFVWSVRSNGNYGLIWRE